MPFTSNGIIGTKFYGKEETSQTKGTYIATRWIVFLYIPILPLGSFRIHPEGKSVSTVLPGSQTEVLERVPLQCWHVCNVYAFIAAMAILANLVGNFRTVSVANSSAPLVSPVPSAPKEPPPPRQAEPVYERPTAAENGTPFPETSGYVEGYAQAFIDGKTVLTVDNVENNYDIHVKLYNLDATPPALASVFFIKASDKFTVETITPGTYELRYRNLDKGDLFRTESFVLKEELDQNSGMLMLDHLTLKLYEIIDGDMETYPIEEEDF